MALLKPSEHCTPEEPASFQLHRQEAPRRIQLCLPHWHLLWLPHGKLTPAPPTHSCIHPLAPCLNYYDGFHAWAMQQWNPFCKLAQLRGCWSSYWAGGHFFFFSCCFLCMDGNKDSPHINCCKITPCALFSRAPSPTQSSRVPAFSLLD